MARREKNDSTESRALGSSPWPWVAAILAIPTFLFRDILFGGSVFFFRDHAMVYLARETSFRAAVREWSIPLWEPLFLGGQPFAANPGRQVFYPPHYLVLIGDLSTGYALFILAHLAVAALGMFVLLRFSGARDSTATLGALTLVLGGPFLSTFQPLETLCALSWMPWILRCTEGFLRDRRPRDFLGATIFLALLALSGDPVQAPLTGALMVGWSVVRQRWDDRRAAVRGAIRDGMSAIAIGVCALLIASVQLWLSFDLVRDTIRTEQMTFEMVSYWSFPPVRSLEFLYPAVFETLAPGRLYREAGGEALLPSVHLGFVVCVLALAGFAARMRGAGWVLGAVLPVGILAAGAHTPLFRLVYDTGLLASQRYPEKLIYPISLVVVFWSALVFERLREGDERLRRWTIGIAATATLVAGLFLASRDSTMTAAAARASNSYWLWMFVIAIIGLALFTFAARSRRELAAILVIAFVVFLDLGSTARRITPAMPGQILDPPAVTAALDTDRGDYRIFNFAAIQFMDDRTPESQAWFKAIGLLLHRNGMFPLSNGIWGYASVLEWDTEHTALTPYVQFQRAMYEVRRSGQPDWLRIFASMSNARYRTEFRSMASAQLRPDTDALSISPVEFVRMDDAPRYYFATSLRRASSPEGFVADLKSGSWSRGATWVDMEPFDPGRGEVLDVNESRHRIELRVRAESRSYLNVAITPHRYWSATIDAVPAPLHVTNIGFQGLEVPEGEHTIELVYRNPVVKPALTVSVVVLALLVIGTIVLERRRRLMPDEPEPHDEE